MPQFNVKINRETTKTKANMDKFSFFVKKIVVKITPLYPT